MNCQSNTKTKDNVTVSLHTSVVYNISPDAVYEAIFTIQDPRGQINSLIDDVLRSSLPQLTLDEAFEAKEEIVQAILLVVRSKMKRFGYNIHSVLITDLLPDASVMRAMNEINSARRLREAALDKAEAEKIIAVKAGEADAETKYLSGVGVARMRNAITDGFKDSVLTMKEKCGLEAGEVVHMMLVTQYLDTLKDFAMNGKSAMVVPHGLSAVTEMQNAVRDGTLQAASMDR